MFESIRGYIRDADERSLMRIVWIWLLAGIVCAAGIWYIGRSYRLQYLNALKSLNRSRTQAVEYLSRHERVEQQRAYVQDILERDPSFKIKEFFNQVVQQMNLQSRLAKPAEVSLPQDLGNGYEELKLESSFTNITTQQLVELLYTIEKNERMYAKDLVITQAKPSTIDATLVIATLQSRAST